MIMYSVFATLLSGLAATFAYRLERGVQHSKVRRSYDVPYDAPSVSVCIPARNETHAMTQCLERVLASDYQKLEIIVFDDASADDTSILVKSFAHAGVRFVPGTSLPEGWLGKNHALEVLAREASGTYIMFLDVDTHIQPTTISELVGYATAEELQMVSVIPERRDIWRASVLFGHLRYYWKLIIGSRLFPTTSSSLWFIRRRTLLSTIGGFVSHRAAVEPEQHIAAIIGSKAYRCLVSNHYLGVSYEKRWSSQCETSRRLLYPMIGGTAMTGVLSLLVLLILNLPLFVLVSALMTGWTIVHGLALVYLMLFALLYARYTYVIWRRNWWLGIIIWPFVIMQELILFISSVIGYAKGTITWKGRPVLSPKQAAESAQ